MLSYVILSYPILSLGANSQMVTVLGSTKNVISRNHDVKGLN
jgi:hypothetical protein